MKKWRVAGFAVLAALAGGPGAAASGIPELNGVLAGVDNPPLHPVAFQSAEVRDRGVPPVAGAPFDLERVTRSWPEILACRAQSRVRSVSIGVSLRRAPDGSRVFLLRAAGGLRLQRVLHESAIEMRNLADYLACADGPEVCPGRFFGADAEDTYKLMIPNAVMLASSPKPPFDASRVARGRMLHFSKMSKFGSAGVAEYFDSGGALVGRLLVALESMPCR